MSPKSVISLTCLPMFCTFPHRLVKLVQNYRSHPKILEFPNREFYRGDLRACADQSKTHRVVGRWSGLVSDNFPIVFHSVRGKDCRDRHSPSYFNADEILVVKEHLTSLLNEASLNLRESGIEKLSRFAHVHSRAEGHRHNNTLPSASHSDSRTHQGNRRRNTSGKCRGVPRTGN